MPAIEFVDAAAQRDDHHCDNYGTALSGTVSAGNGFWSKHRDDVSFTQLQKFWRALTPHARQELLRIDKQMLFEQARKNMYCSRCNGLLLEGFMQVVMYGKSHQQEGVVSHHVCDRSLKNQSDCDFCSNGCKGGDIEDPSIHPWGGLTTTREGMLTLLDCYLKSTSLKGLQNVFDSARAREREREMLYPDACGGGGRGWISQGMVGYGRGHGTRETCALHTARLSVDTLVDFWAALSEETRLSLLRMKEEDFIERLMYRFDSKRFCRDCRRNVIREFKELKELKRTRREPRCTTWFCVADSAFQYEVSHDTVKVDFHQAFVDTFGSYSQFEWAVGTGEGKSDISDFKAVGRREGPVQARGLDLSGLNSCYITLRACKADGHCTELYVKAHALKGQQCVHCRLVVGDGFVTITRGESIGSFFEHAEEAEEEEDDDSMDKDGNDLDGECSRPQKHAKSPELAREFLLDAAAVIFKEQVEKAFREGTARQNAHSIFVCLALKLLEDRVHVACKEIITLEKQTKLLEEEEKEKREEEARKERRRMKEREKKLRRKERLREKEKDREKKMSDSNQNLAVPEISEQESAAVVDDESNVTCDADLVSETGEAVPSGSLPPDIQDEQLLDEFVASDEQSQCDPEVTTNCDDHSKYSRQKLKFRKDTPQGAYSKWSERRRYSNPSENGSMVGKYEPRHHGDNSEAGRRNTLSKSNVRSVGPKYGERSSCPSNKIHDRYDPQSCSCNQYNDYRPKAEQHMSRVVRDNKSGFKSESASDMSKTHHRGNHHATEFVRENCGRSKGKPVNASSPYHRDSVVTKKVWEPMDSQKKCPRSNSDSDVTLRNSTSKGEAPDSVNAQMSNEDQDLCRVRKSEQTDENTLNHQYHQEETSVKCKAVNGEEAELCPVTRSLHGTSDLSMSSFSNSDNCLSCLSEGDSNTSSLNPQNTESSSSSDSEDASQNSEARETSPCHQNGLPVCQEAGMVKGETGDKGQPVKSDAASVACTNTWGTLPSNVAPNNDNGRANPCMNAQPQVLRPQVHNQNIQYPVFPSPPVGYYHQGPLPWAAAPSNGFMPLPNHNQYVYANPFGYGLNGNAHFMPYGTLQHPSAALLNRNHMPVFQSLARGNDIINKMPKPVLLREVPIEANIPSVVPARMQQKDTPVTAESRKMPKPAKFELGSADFSLFHFGGPVDLSTGLKSEHDMLKKEAGMNFSSKLSEDHNEGDQNCNKKNSIEEYNLFAASNGIKFSFF